MTFPQIVQFLILFSERFTITWTLKQFKNAVKRTAATDENIPLTTFPMIMSDKRRDAVASGAHHPHSFHKSECSQTLAHYAEHA